MVDLLITAMKDAGALELSAPKKLKGKGKGKGRFKARLTYQSVLPSPRNPLHGSWKAVK